MIGIGWRPEISGVIAELADLGFCEVIAESVDPAAPPRAVAQLRARGVAIVPHGVRLSLGGAEPVEQARVTQLAACAAAVGAPLVSEHIAFVRAGGREAGHLLPVPRTRDSLDALAANVRRMQAELDVPLALEPIAALLDWPEDEYPEAEFLTRLLDRTGALLLLDVANVYANARNRGQDPQSMLDALPLDRIAYVHIAGGAADAAGLYHDTHTHAVPQPVLDLLTALRARLPAPPPVLLERDGRYPPAAQLHAELAAIAATPDTAPRVGGFGSASRDIRHPESRISTERLPTPTTATGEPDLGNRQAGLVSTLVAGGAAPRGFDTGRLDATRRALVRKRAGEVAKVWPLLAASLGADWPATFAEHAAGRPPVGALREGWDLARSVRARGDLPGGAAAELAEREAGLRYGGTGPPRPRSGAGRLIRRLLSHIRW